MMVYLKRFLFMVRHILKNITDFKFLKIKKITDINNGILLISHESDELGASILLYHIAQEMRARNQSIYIISRQFGVLNQKFSSIASLTVALTRRRIGVIARHLYHEGYKRAICNTTVNGDITRELKRSGYKVISLVHELPKAIETLGIRDRAEELCMHSDAVIFPSTYVYEKLKECVRVTAPVIIQPQGLYMTDKIDFDEAAAGTYLNSKGYCISNKKIILNVGNGTYRKGFDLFLKLAYLMRDEKEFVFIWVGEIEKKILNQFTIKYGADSMNHVIFWGYINNAENLYFMYKKAFVLTLTSREDPFPSVVIQSMAAGTPVIAFLNAGGFTDIVINDITGILVEFESVTEMRDAIIKCCDKDYYKDLKKNSLEAIKGLTMKKYVNRLLELKV